MHTYDMLPESIEQVIVELSALPGVGKRGAKKLALDLVSLDSETFDTLLGAIKTMKTEVSFCPRCGFFTSHKDKLCSICTRFEKGERDGYKICLVEKPTDVLNIEKTQIYNGCYHIIDALISPIDNIFPQDTTISKLFDDTIQELVSKQKKPIELILFFKPGFAADTTKAYIQELISAHTLSELVTVSQLAQGLPLYYNADNLDQATMIKALEDRREV